MNTKKTLPVFSDDILTSVITLDEISDKIQKNEVLTLYHYKVLQLEIEAVKEAKESLAKDLYLKNGELSKEERHAPLRAELVALVRDQQDLNKLRAQSKTMYFEFKQRRAAGFKTPEISSMFRETLNRLWAARREQQQLERIQEIDENLEKYLKEAIELHRVGA